MATARRADPPPGPALLTSPAREQSRARYPDLAGWAERAGGRIGYEVYGAGEPPVMLVPPWQIVHSRIWKGQIPDLARRHRVIVWDARGNGRSDRPTDPQVHSVQERTADLLAVLDATATPAAVLVGLSSAAGPAILAAAEHPERVLGLVLVGPAMPFGDPSPDDDIPFEEDLDTDEAWARQTIHAWRRDFRGYLEFFFGEAFNEPHSTKQIEDSVGYGLETDPETLAATVRATSGLDEAAVRAICARVRCPTLVIQGDRDAIISPTAGYETAGAIPGARLVVLEGAGHCPNVRDPVQVNLLIRGFLDHLQTSAPMARGPQLATEPARRSWTRSLARPRRALFLSSPIGLGHAQRDLAIARELRRLHPDLRVDWLAQDPVTKVLDAGAERIHPMSAMLASESTHIASESTGHELNAFQAIRRMDEILVANFHVFQDAVVEGAYDLVVADEAWDVDYYLHENPELKRTAFAWLTDFVGWLPMPSGGPREASLTADYNAEMIEHIARHPRIRDRAIFIGEPDDIVPDTFGPGLPAIRDWTERNYAFSGYIPGFEPRPLLDKRSALREAFGYRPDERVVIVTVGGSGVGEALLRRVIASYPAAARRVDGLRMIAVAGPRIDPSSLAAPTGVEVMAYVPDLYRRLIACDLAVVQGGLATTMELVAARRPFLYFPLADHFEQTRHVRHRLDRYGAGRCMDYTASPPDVIADAIALELDRPVDYLPVPAEGAARAAALIAPLI